MPENELKQPIHESMIQKLDPEYVEFHNTNLLYLTPPHTLKWDPASRKAPAVPGDAEPLEVGKIQDVDLIRCALRVYTPAGEAPDRGWPVLLYFHGGGWTYGNRASESPFCTHACVGGNCVVVSVDYRLAPEEPYPAAVEDAVESLDWLIENGRAQINVNISRIAVGGSSSGGNLATILALKAIERNLPIKIIFQLLMVPVTDNTATTSDLWKGNQHAPWLTPGRMLWFRNNYLPKEADRKKWDASPAFAPDELVKQLPRAWVAVCELDILKEEGIAYAQKMEKLGVKVEVVVYKGAPHPVMGMAEY